MAGTGHLLLTGRPGCGKTTLIREATEGRDDAGGFYTGEIREAGKRTGFSITALDGRKGILAGVDIRSEIKVGRYGVNIGDIDGIAASAVEDAVSDPRVRTIVIDEIASMELASRRFKETVRFSLDSGKRVLGTIQAKRIPFLDSIRSRSDVRIIEVNPGNRYALKGLLAEWLGPYEPNQ